MRILYIGQQSLESPSGLGRHWPLAKELARLGHGVRIVTLHHDWDTLTARNFVKDGVEVVYAGQMQVLKQGGKKKYFSPAQLLWVTIQSIWRLRRSIVQALIDGFDIVHLMKPQPVNGLAWQLQRGRRGQLLCVDCDDYEAGFVAHRSVWLRWPVTWFENKLPQTADGITVNTHATQERLLAQGLPTTRIHYLPNGVDRSRFSLHDPVREAELCQRYKRNGEQIVIYVGALSIASHAVDLLLDAFVEVEHRMPFTRLLVLGQGADEEVLKHQAHALGIAQKVFFVGQIAPEDVPTYLRIADVSVEATRSTPVAAGRFPLKILESFAAGVPVVCGAVGERADLLHGDDGALAGVLVVPDDAHALANGVVCVLKSSVLAADLRRTAQQQAEKYYWDRLAPNVLNLYKSLLGQNQR